MSESTDTPTCTFHPDRPTLLTCTRCDRPACPDCLRPAAVGMHCVACVKEQAKAGSNVARELTVEQRRARRPGWVFMSLCALFVVLCGFLATMGVEDIQSQLKVPTVMRITSFATVIIGWVISLCIHEWAHAYTAYRSGDWSVVGRGYLTMDPRKYTDALMSVILPIVFLLIGGIPLPGGAVWINHGNIPSRARQAAVSAAGPATNIVFGIVLLLLIKTGMFDSALPLRWTLTYLAWLEFLTAALNLLPIPGLDGFGIIRPFLPHHLQVMAMQFATWGIILLFIVMLQTDAFRFLFDFADSTVQALGTDPINVDFGREVGDVRLLGGGGGV